MSERHCANCDRYKELGTDSRYLCHIAELLPLRLQEPTLAYICAYFTNKPKPEPSEFEKAWKQRNERDADGSMGDSYHSCFKFAWQACREKFLEKCLCGQMQVCGPYTRMVSIDFISKIAAVLDAEKANV